eukprot:10769473-Karenia_brevis.AAC.1
MTICPAGLQGVVANLGCAYVVRYSLGALFLIYSKVLLPLFGPLVLYLGISLAIVLSHAQSGPQLLAKTLKNITTTNGLSRPLYIYLCWLMAPSRFMSATSWFMLIPDRLMSAP